MLCTVIVVLALYEHFLLKLTLFILKSLSVLATVTKRVALRLSCLSRIFYHLHKAELSEIQSVMGYRQLLGVKKRWVCVGNLK